MRNEKWEMRNAQLVKISQIDLWINRKRFFYWFIKRIYKEWITTGLIGKKSWKKQKKYSKEKAAEYYKQNKEVIKEKTKERYKNLSQEEKDKIKEYQKKYQELVQCKKEASKNK